MLSVLIPVYNYRMEAFVSELYAQCERLAEPFEIVLLDDGSDRAIQAANRDLPLHFRNVRYLENGQNLGRSRSRNRLIQEARGIWLWFLDCDGRAFVNDSLLETFWERKDENTLLSGGRVYSKHEPSDASKRLHWLWGATRELLDAKRRMADPVNNFLSNNFWVSKRLIEHVQFETQLQGYGYEDTFFAAQCIEKGFRIEHIENPVLHEGLESVEQFISKIEESLQNLVRLEAICRNLGLGNPLNSRLYSSYKRFRSIPAFIRIPISMFIQRALKFRLIHGKHSLFWFDIYRLAYLLGIKTKALQ
jgi:glycosyltransferase involved in cell wall biosynthesis